MRNRRSALLAAALFAAIGCRTPDPGLEQKRALNAWLLMSFESEAAENAVVRQSTLYPYHFVQDSVALNSLGQADLETLAAHFSRNQGRLNLHRGDETSDLYAGRKQHVLEELALAGVPEGAVEITDGLPGGDGADSERVLGILTAVDEGATPGAKTSSGKKPGASAPTMKLK